MHVLVQRDSIGPEEDPTTPRVRRFDVPDGIALGDFLRRVRASTLLPSVVGGRATWIAEGDRPLAVVTQEYREPWLLVGTAVPLVEVAGRLPKPHVALRYVGQRSPEEAFRDLGGDPVRLSREAFEASADISWTEAFRQFFAPRR